MAINFPSNPSNGDTVLTGTKVYTYNASKGVWKDSDGDNVTQSTLDNYLEVANSSSIGVTTYSALTDLPMSGQTTGKLAFVSGTNRLYIWNGTGWYNIALINTSPTISGASSSYSLNTDGSNTVVTLVASDPEGLPISFTASHTGLGVGANAIATVTQSNNIFTFTPTTNTALAGTFTTTFTASDGVNIAGANSSFTLAFSVNNSNYTTALVTSVGGNNAVNDSFVDSSSNSQTVTTGGTVFTNQFSPYRQAGYSTYLDGNGDFLSIPDHSSFELGSGDFTIETWIYLTALPVNHGGYYAAGICGKDNTATRSYSFTVSCNGSSYTGLAAGLFTGPSTVHNLTYTGTINQNQWYHVAVSRESGTGKLFLNGQVVSTLTGWNHSPTEGTQALVVGAGSNYTNYEYRFPGYLRDFRFVKGTAVYTSAFTPPTEPLTAITNTSVLTCHLPYIADGSTNGHSITVNGNTKTEPFVPYLSNSYTNSYGGSAFFNENTNNGYLRVDAALDGATSTSSPCTIECWLYTDDTSPYDTYGSIFGINRASDGNNQAFFSIHSGGTYYLHYSGNAAASTGDSVRYNQWEHLAFVFNDGSSNVFKWYRNGKLIYQTTEALDTPLSDCTFLIGAEADAANAGSLGNYLKGHLSEVRVSNVARYTAEFTPPTQVFTSDSDTSLLLHFNDGAVIDKSQSIKTLTLNGDVKSSTTQTKYLSSSMYFDGTGDYITVSKSDLISNWNSENFTIESWLYPTASSGYRVFFGDWGGLPRAFATGILNGNWWFEWTPNGGSTSTLTGSAVTLNQWYHFAVTKSGTTVKIYINGTLDATQTGVSLDNSSAHGTFIGSYASGTGAFYSGYASDFRFSRGLVRYTSNFTPPTAALLG